MRDIIRCDTTGCDNWTYGSRIKKLTNKILKENGWLVFNNGKSYCPSCRKERLRSAHESIYKNLSRPVYQFHQFEEPKVFDNE